MKALTFIKDEKGSIAPFIAFILIICIGLGAVNIALSMLYRDRTIVRDALDAACTSSLAGAAEEKWRSLKYMEEPIVEVNEYNEVTMEYYPIEEIQKSYIFLNREKAEEILVKVFEKNLEMNAMPYTLKGLDIVIEYEPHETSRQTVLKERYEVTVQPENWWITEKLYNPDETGERPDSWNNHVPRQTKQIKYPRWVKIKATADIELKTPMAKVVKGQETVDIKISAEAVKELITSSREEQEKYTGE